MKIQYSKIKVFPLLFFILIFLNFFNSTVFAQDNQELNNKFGIHLAQPHLDALEEAQQLVNSNGGDWGYVTLVLQENDKRKEKWQDIFNRLRKLHLIPIIRLATVPEGNSWRKPGKEEADDWVNFLDSLNWVVKNRYIILFNEPNHGAEWGGSVDPAGYAEVARTFAEKLKAKNPDFFVMLSAIDASAPQLPPDYVDEEIFLKDFFNNITIKQFNSFFSGLASHSYPNPAFAGSPYDTGRGTVRTYQWEIDLFKNFGVKDLPVFITETGWKRQGRYLTENTVGQNLKTAFENVWLPDKRVAAVTPFVLDYQGDPFLDFSWKLPSAQVSEERKFYQQYYDVQSIEKSKGDPVQIEKGEITYSLPKQLVVESNYNFKIKIKNTGQAIWDKDQGYSLSPVSSSGEKFDYLFNDLKNIKPNDEAEIDLFFKTGSEAKNHSVVIALFKDNKRIISGNGWNFTTTPLPALDFAISLFPKFVSGAEDFQVQIFDDQEKPVFKRSNISVSFGTGKINDIQNIILGKKYRVVLIKKNYLPRQQFVVFKKGENQAKFKRMYPLDFNNDGKFGFNDIEFLIRHPEQFSLLFP